MFRRRTPLTLSVYLILGLLGASSTASAGPWFNHRFGELRAYHGAWLNVCADKGAGPCRAVQSYIPPGSDSFFGESKLTVHLNRAGEASLELYDAGMPPLKSVFIDFYFGVQRISVNPEQWRLGERDIENVAETIYFPPSEVTAMLVKLIRAKDRLKVTYLMPDGRTGEARFSLRGSAQALDAIRRHLATRTMSAP